MNRTLALLAVSVAALGPSAAPAQAPPDPPPVTITLRPAAEPVPALKYRLVPERRTLVPGNAAVFYHRGIQSVLQTRLALSDPKRVSPKSAVPDEVEYSRWLSLPLAEVPRDQAV